ncbi:MAG TPA: TIM44-like domain-containing protein [Burkholderiales bacterium]|jgi:predicted lipid-binding transport protein (Tim44 family)|nr:TIM44-like domain-containing protein [Burkholderiales bacterium]
MTTIRNKFANWMTGATMALVLGMSFALVAHDAEAAKRFGGGKSFGRQMNRDGMQQPAKPPAQQQNAAQPGTQTPPAAAPAGNRWMGPLAGIAAGLGIFALLSHFGLGEGLAAMLGNMLVIALLVFAGLFLWRMLKRSASPGLQAPARREAFQGAAPVPSGNPGLTNAFGNPVGGRTPEPVAQSISSIPADFDVEGFLRIAKVNFNRLQAAWDSRDLDDIRKFTTPEVFAEIKMQRDEDQATSERHEVDNLGAELLGIETTAEDYVASVRFFGVMRGNGGAAEPFEETWNLVKPVNGRSGWLLGGIEQAH